MSYSHEPFSIALSAYETTASRLERLVRVLSELEYRLRHEPKSLFLITELHDHKGELSVRYVSEPPATLRSVVESCWDDGDVIHEVQS